MLVSWFETDVTKSDNVTPPFAFSDHQRLSAELKPRRRALDRLFQVIGVKRSVFVLVPNFVVGESSHLSVSALFHFETDVVPVTVPVV